MKMRFRALRHPLGRCFSSKGTPYAVSVHPLVAHALEEKKPVVALESTIISHGMPYPRNVEVAREIEALIRSEGVIPATCAVINGVPKVGLTDEELEYLGQADAHSISKASRRDLAQVVGSGASAATTVAGTMILAHRAGIRVFATGGLGGVHRGAEMSFDVSADLTELSRTPVAVVCGGVKSILDIPKTLEVLETQGVPVLTYGGAPEFPAFFTNDSGIPSPLVARDSMQVAQALHASDALELNTGTVIAVPNPQPASGKVITQAIDEALSEASRRGVAGAATTPFLLASIEKSTGGSSLDANIALVMNNARVACDIAKAYCSRPTETTPRHVSDATLAPATPATDESASKRKAKEGPVAVLVFGGAVVDTVGHVRRDVQAIRGSSNPGTVVQGYGGVARNVSEGLGRLGSSVALVSAVGDDELGKGLLEYTRDAGVRMDYVCVAPVGSTASYLAVHSADGDLLLGCADMDMTAAVNVDVVNGVVGAIRGARMVVTDGNLVPESLSRVVRLCESYNVQFAFEPTSDHRAEFVVSKDILPKVSLIKPNFSELQVILKSCLRKGYVRAGRAMLEDALERADGLTAEDVKESTVVQLAVALQRIMSQQDPAAGRTPGVTAAGGTHLLLGKHVLVSLGARGAVWAGPIPQANGHNADFFDSVSQEGIAAKVFPGREVPEENIVNASGAGDTLLAGLLHGLLSGRNVFDSIDVGLNAAALSVQSPSPCPLNIRLALGDD